MANLTIAVDDELLRAARIRALEQGTSVNAILRGYLEAFAGTPAAQRAGIELLDRARRSRAGSGHLGRAWTRDDLHDR